MSENYCRHLSTAARIIQVVGNNANKPKADLFKDFNDLEKTIPPLLLEAGLIKESENGCNYAVTWKGLQFCNYYGYLQEHGIFNENSMHDSTHRPLFLFF